MATTVPSSEYRANLRACLRMVIWCWWVAKGAGRELVPAVGS